MSRKLVLLMVAVLALAMFAVACGGDDQDAATEDAIAQCKQSFQNQPQLSDDTKADLEEICEKAAEGDEEEVRDATREVCTKIIEDTVPEGNPAREQALETCKTAAP